MKKLFNILLLVFLSFLVGCAAFQTQPALKNFTGLDLYQYIDAKADSSQSRFERVVRAYNGLYLNNEKLLRKLNETNSFLIKENADGKLQKSTIEGLNRRGFRLNFAEPDDLPSSVPDDSTSNGDALRSKQF